VGGDGEGEWFQGLEEAVREDDLPRAKRIVGEWGSPDDDDDCCGTHRDQGEDAATPRTPCGGGKHPRVRARVLNRRNVFQSCLIHIAAKNGSEGMVRLLVESGADINALDYGGLRKTALHWAALKGHLQVVELLVALGINVTGGGQSWGRLMDQAGGCGSKIDTASPCESSPQDLAGESWVRMAIDRPNWSSDNHREFPAKFRASFRTLLMFCTRESVGLDIAMQIAAHMAYPLSSWL